MAYPVSFFLAFALLVCVATATEADAEFAYSGPHGPESWGTLDPSFAACSSGKCQSPINFVKGDVAVSNNLPALNLNYETANATLVNSEHAIGLDFDSPAGDFTVNGKNYTLMKLHWHIPSEHQIDGKQYTAELHLVHKSKSGDLAVVGILYQLGQPDPFIAKLTNQLKELVKDACLPDQESKVLVGELDISLSRKGTQDYFRYDGSLTTPPCTENVIWTVLAKVRSISADQVALLHDPLEGAFKRNARPVQPLNARKVEFYCRYLKSTKKPGTQSNTQ